MASPVFSVVRFHFIMDGDTEDRFLVHGLYDAGPAVTLHNCSHSGPEIDRRGVEVTNYQKFTPRKAAEDIASTRETLSMNRHNVSENSETIGSKLNRRSCLCHTECKKQPLKLLEESKDLNVQKEVWTGYNITSSTNLNPNRRNDNSEMRSKQAKQEIKKRFREFEKWKQNEEYFANNENYDKNHHIKSYIQNWLQDTAGMCLSSKSLRELSQKLISNLDLDEIRNTNTLLKSEYLSNENLRHKGMIWLNTNPVILSSNTKENMKDLKKSFQKITSSNTEDSKIRKKYNCTIDDWLQQVIERKNTQTDAPVKKDFIHNLLRKLKKRPESCHFSSLHKEIWKWLKSLTHENIVGDEYLKKVAILLTRTITDIVTAHADEIVAENDVNYWLVLISDLLGAEISDTNTQHFIKIIQKRIRNESFCRESEIQDCGQNNISLSRNVKAEKKSISTCIDNEKNSRKKSSSKSYSKRKSSIIKKLRTHTNLQGKEIELIADAIAKTLKELSLSKSQQDLYTKKTLLEIISEPDSGNYKNIIKCCKERVFARYKSHNSLCSGSGVINHSGSSKAQPKISTPHDDLSKTTFKIHIESDFHEEPSYNNTNKAHIIMDHDLSQSLSRKQEKRKTTSQKELLNKFHCKEPYNKDKIKGSIKKLTALKELLNESTQRQCFVREHLLKTNNIEETNYKSFENDISFKKAPQKKDLLKKLLNENNICKEINDSTKEGANKELTIKYRPGDSIKIFNNHGSANKTSSLSKQYETSTPQKELSSLSYPPLKSVNSADTYNQSNEDLHPSKDLSSTVQKEMSNKLVDKEPSKDENRNTTPRIHFQSISKEPFSTTSYMKESNNNQSLREPSILSQTGIRIPRPQKENFRKTYSTISSDPTSIQSYTPKNRDITYQTLENDPGLRKASQIKNMLVHCLNEMDRKTANGNKKCNLVSNSKSMFQNIKDLLSKWLNDINLSSINEKMVDILAQDILDRQKYLQISNSVPSYNEEQNYLKRQIFKRFNNVANDKDLSQALQNTSDLFDKLKSHLQIYRLISKKSFNTRKSFEQIIGSIDNTLSFIRTVIPGPVKRSFAAIW
ncbi:unnamed protein product [Leptidea sinapis]|uniref:Uncharacterized protein n=1 Tax=Leptidea sinapis TaxID=189913 RepID=A0A5E4QUK3_9NEOP|nr:unnamed protein product [Leptidea sinapis]